MLDPWLLGTLQNLPNVPLKYMLDAWLLDTED